MISVLFENESLLKDTKFGLGLIYQSELKLIKRENKDIMLDINILIPDILFIDLSNDLKEFIEKVKSFRTANKNLKIVLLLDFYSDHIFWIAKKLKLNGIFQKDINTTKFIKKILSITETSNKSDFQNYKPSIDFEQIKEILTSTEKIVFKFIGKGLTTQEISDLLLLSKRTVEHHRANILQKLDCKCFSKLIYVATAYSILELF